MPSCFRHFVLEILQMAANHPFKNFCCIFLQLLWGKSGHFQIRWGNYSLFSWDRLSGFSTLLLEWICFNGVFYRAFCFMNNVFLSFVDFSKSDNESYNSNSKKYVISRNLFLWRTNVFGKKETNNCTQIIYIFFLQRN